MSESQTNPEPVTAAAVRGRGPGVAQLGIVVAILAAGVVVTALTSDVTRVSEPGVRLENGAPYLPESFGDWKGGELEGLTEDERRILPPDTLGARREYTDAAGRRVYCSVVLAGRDVTSIHRPELCLPGQGWTYHEWVEAVPVAAAPNGRLKVMRMNAVRQVPLPDGRTAQVRAVFVYWFVGKERLTPHHWERIFWTARDRVLHNRNHRWAYIMVHAPVTAEAAAGGRAEDETMRLVARFVQEIYPELAAQ
jgi:EpsI family protein